MFKTIWLFILIIILFNNLCASEIDPALRDEAYKELSEAIKDDSKENKDHKVSVLVDQTNKSAKNEEEDNTETLKEKKKQKPYLATFPVSKIDIAQLALDLMDKLTLDSIFQTNPKTGDTKRLTIQETTDEDNIKDHDIDRKNNQLKLDPSIHSKDKPLKVNDHLAQRILNEESEADKVDQIIDIMNAKIKNEKKDQKEFDKDDDILKEDLVEALKHVSKPENVDESYQQNDQGKIIHTIKVHGNAKKILELLKKHVEKKLKKLMLKYHLKIVDVKV